MAAGQTDVPPDRCTPRAPLRAGSRRGESRSEVSGYQGAKHTHPHPPFFGSAPALLARRGDAARSRRAGCCQRRRRSGRLTAPVPAGSSAAHRWQTGGMWLCRTPAHSRGEGGWQVGRVTSRRRGCRNVHPGPQKSDADPGKDGQNGIPRLPQNGWRRAEPPRALATRTRLSCTPKSQSPCPHISPPRGGTCPGAKSWRGVCSRDGRRRIRP